MGFGLIQDARDDGGRMKGRPMSDMVKLNRKKDHGKYGDANHCLIFTFWNYHEKIIVIGTDG